MRHRRDSLSGLSTQSQPLIFGGGGFGGTHSPAPTFHSGSYYYYSNSIAVTQTSPAFPVDKPRDAQFIDIPSAIVVSFKASTHPA